MIIETGKLRNGTTGRGMAGRPKMDDWPGMATSMTGTI